MMKAVVEFTHDGAPGQDIWNVTGSDIQDPAQPPVENQLEPWMLRKPRHRKPVPQCKRDALWIWGTLRDVVDDKKQIDIPAAVAAMSDLMINSAAENLPIVIGWLGRMQAIVAGERERRTLGQAEERPS